MSALQTVDLTGVEILGTGGPVHGVGSAAGGDHWTSEKLRAVAEANHDLGDELRPPATVGHAASGDPAVGWLENVRINSSGDKLLADIRQVPRRFAELVKAGAYRSRSVELSRVTSQRTGRSYELAVSGLAFLGASLPAVRTLSDVRALYADDRVELQRVYSVETAPVDDQAERERIARMYGLDVEDVPAVAVSDEPTSAAAALNVIDAMINRGALPVSQRLEALAGFVGDATAERELERRDLADRERISRTYGIPIENVS